MVYILDFVWFSFVLFCLVWFCFVCRLKYFISGKCFVFLLLQIYFLFYFILFYFILVKRLHTKQILFGLFMHMNTSIVSFIFLGYHIAFLIRFSNLFPFCFVHFIIMFLSLLLHFQKGLFAFLLPLMAP